MDKLKSSAERFAALAIDLEAFAGTHLPTIRDAVDEALLRISSLGFFDGYTKHDSVHIDAMLEIYDWLIPDLTRDAMTPADWLLLVVSTYLHDFGMIVTREEFEARAATSFGMFKNDLANEDSNDSKDYRASLKSIPDGDKEQFLYQEFVRTNHAARIRSWLSAEPDPKLGFDARVVELLHDTFRTLDSSFLDDVGLVCESHHRSDLSDVAKYGLDRPYGRTLAEAANVQYVAILLRAADLLHITRDRTPAVAFRLINPKNATSLMEWARHQPVRTVRPKRAAGAEAEDSVQQPKSDTVEVHARFTDGRGFFGLTSYLQYASGELKKCASWVGGSRQNAPSYEFPWTRIDSTHVEAKGFVSRQFEFRLDQHKVLDLLTGHTLYNDTSVVLRELVQNAIDAVRLQRLSLSEPTYVPHVKVSWSPDERVLQVVDNGTGMSEAIIEENFLHVGSSHYQSEEFRSRYPQFSSISRFGIGVLSAFMISDDVQVLTSHPEDASAREITLESVHGQYLMRLLPKTSTDIPAHMRDHGTSIRLRVRESAKSYDVLELLRHWIVVPGCRVSFQLADGEEQVGFSDVATALAYWVSVYEAQSNRTGPSRLEVRTFCRDGLDLAYVVEWSEWFKEYRLLGKPDSSDPFRFGLSTQNPRRIRSQELSSWDGSTGTLIEGVRVTTDPPGLSGSGVWALANCTGLGSPRTNVARSALEAGPELKQYVQLVYNAYSEHVHSEVKALHEDRGFSLTRAIFEAPYVAAVLTDSRVMTSALEYPAYLEMLSALPVYLLEDLTGRHAVSAREVAALSEFVTVENEIVESMDYLLASLPNSVTLREMLNFLGSTAVHLPSEPILRLGRTGGVFTDLLLSMVEVKAITVTQGVTLNCHWGPIASESSWVTDYDRRAQDILEGMSRDGLGFSSTFLAPMADLTYVGPTDLQHLRVMGMVLLLPGHPALDVEPVDADCPLWMRRWFAAFLAGGVLSRGLAGQDRSDAEMDAYVSNLRAAGILDHFRESSVLNAIARLSPQILNPRGSWRGMTQESQDESIP